MPKPPTSRPAAKVTERAEESGSPRTPSVSPTRPSLATSSVAQSATRWAAAEPLCADRRQLLVSLGESRVVGHHEVLAAHRAGQQPDGDALECLGQERVQLH